MPIINWQGHSLAENNMNNNSTVSITNFETSINRAMPLISQHMLTLVDRPRLSTIDVRLPNLKYPEQVWTHDSFINVVRFVIPHGFGKSWYRRRAPTYLGRKSAMIRIWEISKCRSSASKYGLCWTLFSSIGFQMDRQQITPKTWYTTFGLIIVGCSPRHDRIWRQMEKMQ